MAIVACPTCLARLEVDDRHLGQQVDCGACGAVFTAKADRPPADEPRREDRPSRRRRRSRDDEDDDYDDRPRRRRFRTPEDAHEYAVRELTGPGLGIQIVAGLLGVLTVLVGAAQAALMLAIPRPPNQPPNADSMRLVLIGVYAASALLGAVYFGLLVFAGNKMRRADSWGWSLAAVIMSFLPVLPMCGGCGGLGLCGGLFIIPFGIWGLVVLLQQNVRDALVAATPSDD